MVSFRYVFIAAAFVAIASLLLRPILLVFPLVPLILVVVLLNLVLNFVVVLVFKIGQYHIFIILI